jgi:methyl-accepting chemotaxis protein
VNLNNLKIAHKLTAAFALVVATIIALGAVVFLQLENMSASAADVARGEAVLRTLTRVQRSIDQQETNTLAYVSVQNPHYLERIEVHEGRFEENITQLRERMSLVPDSERMIDALVGAVEDYRREIVEAETRLASDPANHAQAVALIESGAAATWVEPVDAALEALTEVQQERLEQFRAAQEGANRVATIAVFAGAGVATALAMFFGWMLSTAIGKPVVNMTTVMRKLAGGDKAVEVPGAGRKDEIGQMAAAVLAFKDAAIANDRLEGEAADQRRMTEEERARAEAERAESARQQAAVVAALAEGLEQLSKGNLTYRLTQTFPEEYVKLQSDFNAAMGQLKDAMTTVVTNVSAIRSGAGEISQAADDLSRRTEQQAASLEETAAALDQITATVRKTASGAKQCSDVVLAARGDAEKSGEIVRDAVGAMSAIEQSSTQISQIIGVIDEIAFQTNLLALNAGVEAARAGDAGRGFAVVASEVRALAQRSADAAKEIKTLISSSGTQVGAGVSLVGQTGEALNRIVERVAEIDGLVSEISASAQEQATGLQQVNTAVNQMDQVTQQNAAMVEQSTAASHSLAQEADVLNQSVSRFEIGEHDRASAPAASKPAAHAKPASKPSAVQRTVTALKAMGVGGAARKLETVAAEDGWEEF